MSRTLERARGDFCVEGSEISTTENGVAALIKQNLDLFEIGPNVPEGGRGMQKQQPTWRSLLSKFAGWQDRCQASTLCLAEAQRDGLSAKEVLKRQVLSAEQWRAMLAPMLLFWYAGRYQTLRRRSVNWDIYRVQGQDGQDQSLVDPTEDKTVFF